jgi:dsRNA-specific ribonuclease
LKFHFIIFILNFSFAVAVLLDDRQFPAAFASTKREASIQAAYKALYQLSLDARQSQVI